MKLRISLFSCCTLVGSATAQTPPPAELDTVIVQASRKPASQTVPSAEESRKELEKTPGGTEVIDAERYLTGRASTLADTFALSPGVLAQSRFGSDEARLSIRGSGIQRTFHGRGIRVLQDGVPINLADGAFDMQAIEPTAADYINVWRGGNALAYGSSTLGGAIDYISRTGRTSPGGFARLEAGSWDYLRATVATGVSDDTKDAYASFTQQSQSGFRDHADQNNERLFTNFGWKLTDNLETRLYITGVHSESELPGNLTKAQLEDDPRQAAAANVALDQERDYDLLRIASKTALKVDDSTWTLTAGWTYKDLNHPIYQVIDQLSNDALLGISYTNEHDLFGNPNLLRTGVLYTQGETHAAQYVNVGGGRGALTQDSDQTATNLEAYVEDQYTLGYGFTGILGSSAAHNTRKLDQVYAGSPSYDYDYDDYAPKVGLRWDGEGYQLFANVSGSYEPPSFSETYTANTARDAQSATTYEIGTRGTRSFVRWDATAYHADVKNELLTVQDPITNLSTTTNAERTTHSGVELGFAVDLLGQSWDAQPDNRIVFQGAWTYGKYEFERHAAGGYDYSGNEIAGLPPHIIHGELLWQHGSGWYAGPTFEWVPESYYIDHRNTFSADPYSLIGFKFGQRRETGISWFVELKNLADERYASTTGVIDNANGKDSAQFLPGDGRSIFAGVEWKW